MDIRIDNVQQTTQVQQTQAQQEVSGDFKFTLTSKIEDASLAERLNLMMEEIVQQGKQISKKKLLQKKILITKDY